jgi:hypothetical protein
MLNATYLFAGRTRDYRNSESWWTSFFSILLLFQSRTNPSFSLPIYTYSAERLRKVSDLDCKSLSFSTVRVEACLSATPFGLPAWPNEYLFLKPDLSLVDADRRRVTLVEVKTIGETVARNVDLYKGVCRHLSENGWSAELCYLLSHGHEDDNDWRRIDQHQLRMILWEDVLEAVISTPLASIFDVDLAAYASRPEVPVDYGTT